MTHDELKRRCEENLFYTIDALNHAGCWENLMNIQGSYQGGWHAGYEFYRWYLSLKICPNSKYREIRLTLDRNDDKGACTVCSKELVPW